MDVSTEEPANSAVTSRNSADKFRERFLAVQKRRQESCRGSEARRMRELKLSLLNNVKQQLQSSDEIKELEKCNVNLEQLKAEAEAEKKLNKRKRKCNNKNDLLNKKQKQDSSCDNNADLSLQPDLYESESTANKTLTDSIKCCNGKASSTASYTLTNCNQSSDTSDRLENKNSNYNHTAESDLNSKWLELKPYLTINDHLARSSGSGRQTRSHLEERIEKAIELNEVDLAERLSDKLSERDFGVRIAQAIDAKAYVEKQKIEKEAQDAARKKKLAWGFVPKHRWETKGNM